jgi:hypothetical protein
MIRRLAYFLTACASPQASPVLCCFASMLLLAAPIAVVTPVRASEINNTLPAEEETKSASEVNATHNQIRHRSRPMKTTFMPVLRSTCIVTSSHARTSAPNGLNEHAQREGLGTPLRC